MQRFAILLVPFAWSCTVSSEPCDDYVDYMCDCHPEDPDDPDGVDCEELQTQFSGTDPTLEDECISSLADQENEDEANGWVCPGA
jgi:hypothetical protein